MRRGSNLTFPEFYYTRVLLTLAGVSPVLPTPLSMTVLLNISQLTWLRVASIPWQDSDIHSISKDFQYLMYSFIHSPNIYRTSLSNSVRGYDFDNEVVHILSFPKDERLVVRLLSHGTI